MPRSTPDRINALLGNEAIKVPVEPCSNLTAVGPAAARGYGDASAGVLVKLRDDVSLDLCYNLCLRDHRSPSRAEIWPSRT